MVKAVRMRRSDCPKTACLVANTFMGNPLRYGLEIAGMFLAGTIYPDQKLLSARLKLYTIFLNRKPS